LLRRRLDVGLGPWKMRKSEKKKKKDIWTIMPLVVLSK